MHLYVVRHGETDLNKVKRIQGPLIDSPLNANGLAQAEALADRFATDRALPRPDMLLSSPMRRAAQTAEALTKVLQVPWEIDERLKEFDWGRLNGEVDAGEVHETLERFITAWTDGDLEPTPDGGENPRQVVDRTMAAIEDRLKAVGPDGTLVIVAHGRLNKVLIAHLVHGSAARQEDVHQHNASLTLLKSGDGKTWEPVFIDDWSHAKGLVGEETV